MKSRKLKELLQPIESLIGLDHWWDRVDIICDKLIKSVTAKLTKYGGVIYLPAHNMDLDLGLMLRMMDGLSETF